eukprot:2919209-Rhodomonas_salina.3
MRGTELAYAHTMLAYAHVMGGTGLAYADTMLTYAHTKCGNGIAYAHTMCGTELAFGSHVSRCGTRAPDSSSTCSKTTTR